MKIFILEDDPMRIGLLRQAAIGVDADFATDMSEVPKDFDPSIYGYMFLDHDLGGLQMVNPEEENTGTQFCKNLPDAGNISPRVIVHSYNNNGAMRMCRILRDKGYAAIYVPFGNSTLEYVTACGPTKETFE